MSNIINKTMDREDLFDDDLALIIRECNQLLDVLYSKNLYPSSWVGTLPSNSSVKPKKSLLNKFIYDFLRTKRKSSENSSEEVSLNRGIEQRLNYEEVPGSRDDIRIPWFLLWEIGWVMKVTKKYLAPHMKILDAGGTSSLFTCYLSSLGFDIHSVDLNEKLRQNGDFIAKKMNWNMHSYAMNLEKMDFPDNYFDHAYSICVFEHLDYEIKQKALAEIARCLKPNGILSITFDYRNPAPGVFGYGKDTRVRNRLATIKDIEKNFLSSGHFSLIENQEFYDNGKSYLVHKEFGNTPYTFGAIFLRKWGEI